jgi:uncharacterized protein (DUF1810 family)
MLSGGLRICSLALITAADHKSFMADLAGADDRFGLNRFVQAQEEIYPRALVEIKVGRKRSHWMWFIFPQIHGLAHSSNAKFYAIKSKDEAAAYLNHALLGKRLVECAEALLKIQGKSAAEMFGYPDDLKLHSSMTLFTSVSETNSIFSQVLDKYYDSQPDAQTLELLRRGATA